VRVCVCGGGVHGRGCVDRDSAGSVCVPITGFCAHCDAFLDKRSGWLSWST
jgi:hypothetical protein